MDEVFNVFFHPKPSGFNYCAAQAGEVCYPDYDCKGNNTPGGYQLVCQIVKRCMWVPDPLPPPPLKTADEIAWEQHVKWCKDFPAEVELAVQRCQNQALGYNTCLSQLNAHLGVHGPWTVLLRQKYFG